jgi:hypothetical protein
LNTIKTGKEIVADAITGDMINLLLESQSELLAKGYCFYSAFGSIGGILSLMFDYMDGKNDGKDEISLRPTIII